MHIRDPEEILYRGNSSFKTLIIHKKNYLVTFAEISYVYVSKGFLSIGEKKLSGKVASGGSDFR